MKYIAYIALLILTLTLNASYVKQENNETLLEFKKKFPYIEPVSVEITPEIIEKIVLDSDNDGLTDDKDQCPHTKFGEEIDEFGCLIKKDDDSDGIPNEIDECPNTSKDIHVNSVGCQLDSDKDGIADVVDMCPGTGENFSVDEYGCPMTATLKLNFAFNEYAITKDIMADIEKFAQFLKDNAGYRVIIYGHADEIGTEYQNQILSENRANAVKETLIELGIDKNRLTSFGRGSKFPIADNSTEEGRAQNRRIEAELIK